MFADISGMMAGKGEWLQKSKKGNTPVKFAVADRLLKVRFPTVKVKNPSPKKWLSDAFSSDEDMIDAEEGKITKPKRKKVKVNDENLAPCVSRVDDKKSLRFGEDVSVIIARSLRNEMQNRKLKHKKEKCPFCPFITGNAKQMDRHVLKCKK